MEKFEFLKQRAKEFYEEVEKLFENKKFNLSAFNLEQAVQIWVKYLIVMKVGDFPKTHYFLKLVSELAKAWDGNQEILNFYKENELFFDDLEGAYFTSRYFPKVFTENGVKLLFEKAKDFIALTEKETQMKFYD